MVEKRDGPTKKLSNLKKKKKISEQHKICAKLD